MSQQFVDACSLKEVFSGKCKTMSKHCCQENCKWQHKLKWCPNSPVFICDSCLMLNELVCLFLGLFFISHLKPIAVMEKCVLHVSQDLLQIRSYVYAEEPNIDIHNFIGTFTRVSVSLFPSPEQEGVHLHHTWMSSLSQHASALPHIPSASLLILISGTMRLSFYYTGLLSDNFSVNFENPWMGLWWGAEV